MDKVKVIAEIGSNHCGKLPLAFQLIDLAKDAGADIVKFQAFNWSSFTSTEEWHKRKDFARDAGFLQFCAGKAQEVGVEFMVTPTYPQVVPDLDPLVKRWKVASADVGRADLVDALDATGKEVLYSTGLGKVLTKHNWIPLMCVARYPAKVEDYALGTVYHWPWGLSDHTTNHAAVLAAVTQGATFIEKHIKLHNQPASPDSGPWAYTPGKFARMVYEIRQIEAALERALPASEQLSMKGRKVWEP